MTGRKKEEGRTSGQVMSVSRWGFFSIIAIGAFLIIVIVLMASGFFSSNSIVPSQTCAEQALVYINTNLPPTTGGPAKLVAVRQQHDNYEITILFNGRNTTVYSSKDCNLLFTKTYTMNQSGMNNAATLQVTQTTVAPAIPQKSNRPTVDLYVMSFCPFGVQAETAMKPVAALLGTKADFRVHYIVTVKNSTLAGIQSLHGPEEAKEDLRQLCVMTYYPEKFWAYIEGINARCYPVYSRPGALETCWRNVSSSLAIDANKVTACAYSSEGIAMIAEDEQVTSVKRITGSPTLHINNQTYAGQRTAEAYKKAVCDRFITPPSECTTILSDQTGQVSGSCG